jgi:hypothetical protein
MEKPVVRSQQPWPPKTPMETPPKMPVETSPLDPATETPLVEPALFLDPPGRLPLLISPGRVPEIEEPTEESVQIGS